MRVRQIEGSVVIALGAGTCGLGIGVVMPVAKVTYPSVRSRCKGLDALSLSIKPVPGEAGETAYCMAVVQGPDISPYISEGCPGARNKHGYRPGGDLILKPGCNLSRHRIIKIVVRILVVDFGRASSVISWYTNNCDWNPGFSGQSLNHLCFRVTY